MTFTFGVDPLSTPSAGDGGGDNTDLITSGVLASPGGTVLSTSGTIISISIYVLSGATGNVLLGLYDNSGTGGQAGSLVASCPSSAIANGWNTFSVSTQVQLAAATYWFAFTPNSGTPVFTSNGLGFTRFITGQSFTMPGTAPTLSSTTTQNYSMYATLNEVLMGQECL